MATVRQLFAKPQGTQPKPLNPPSAAPQAWLDPRVFAPEINMQIPLKGDENLAAGISAFGQGILKGVQGSVEKGLKERELSMKEQELPVDLKLKEAQASYWLNNKGQGGGGVSVAGPSESPLVEVDGKIMTRAQYQQMQNGTKGSMFATPSITPE